MPVPQRMTPAPPMLAAGWLEADDVSDLPAEGRAFPASPGGEAAGATAGAATPLPGMGMPQDRHCWMASRRTLGDLKRQFRQAMTALEGHAAEALRAQVRQAAEPSELWQLQHAVLAMLADSGPAAERAERELRAALASVFPSAGRLQPYGAGR